MLHLENLGGKYPEWCELCKHWEEETSLCKNKNNSETYDKPIPYNGHCSRWKPNVEEDPHKLNCGTCQIFLDEDCETYYDCPACYECAELGGVWEPRYKEDTES